MIRAIFIFVLSLSGAFAFSPALERVEPRGGERGTEVRLELIGKRIFSPEELLFYRPGLKVLSIKPGKKPTIAFATIFIPEDAALGEYPLRLRCKEGLTEMKTFWVGQYATVREKRSKDGKREFNNSFDKPQEIRTNVTVQGVAEREDSDYYLVHCKKGQRLSAEVEGMRLGRVMFDSYVEIISPDGDVLASNDDSPLLGRDCATSILIPADGAYRILVRESALEGSSQAQYRLHVGHFPRPTWVSPISGKPGETKEFTFHGDPTGPLKKTITLTEESQAHTIVHAGHESPSGHLIHVSPLDTQLESEPNNPLRLVKKDAPLPSVPFAVEGTLDQKEDIDWFVFKAKKGQKIRAKVIARSLNSPIDSLIQIRPDKKGKSLGANDDVVTGTPDSRVDVTIPEDGRYGLMIRDQLRRSGPDFRYRIEVTTKPSSLEAALPSSDRNNDQKYKYLSVPRGGRLAIVPNITRKNTSSELDLVIPKLPAGLSAKSFRIGKKLSNFPILFEAKADAPLAGDLVSFSLKNPASPLSGILQEKIAHVKINNLGTYHATTHDRIAVAIIEKAPFSFTLEPPKAPIVPGGIHTLNFHLKREPGFDAPVKVTLPFKPPGITAPTEVEIPKGQTQGTLTLNAKKDAKPAEWQICLTARAQTKRGEVRLSSQLHPLTISERYLTLTLEMATTYPGQNTSMIAKLNHEQPFEGEATLTLEALPHGVSSSPVKITKDTKEIEIPLTVNQDVRRGRHRNIFAKVNVLKEKQSIVHQLGHGGTLRIKRPPHTAQK